jgi:hypothetical protein
MLAAQSRAHFVGASQTSSKAIVTKRDLLYASQNRAGANGLLTQIQENLQFPVLPLPVAIWIRERGRFSASDFSRFWIASI